MYRPKLGTCTGSDAVVGIIGSGNGWTGGASGSGAAGLCAAAGPGARSGRVITVGRFNAFERYIRKESSHACACSE
jgi:hypothetical protein